MVHINLNDVSGVTEDELLKRISEGRPELLVTMLVRGRDMATSKSELASTWLTSWFIAESLAVHTSGFEYEFDEKEDGACAFRFSFRLSNAKGLAAAMLALAPGLDPDDFEANELLVNGAYRWLERSGKTPSRFSDIEQCYRQYSEPTNKHEDEDADYPDEEEYAEEFQ